MRWPDIQNACMCEIRNIYIQNFGRAIWRSKTVWRDQARDVRTVLKCISNILEEHEQDPLPQARDQKIPPVITFANLCGISGCPPTTSSCSTMRQNAPSLYTHSLYQIQSIRFLPKPSIEYKVLYQEVASISIAVYWKRANFFRMPGLWIFSFSDRKQWDNNNP